MGHGKLGSAAGPAGLVIATAIAALLASGAARAAGEDAALFDPPVSVQRLEPKSAGAGPTIVCTRFDDLTIREQQDGPTSTDAGLIAKGGSCGRGKAKGETRVRTAGMYFLGRKGPGLIFEEMDPHGAVGFVVIDAETGKLVYRDATVSSPTFSALSWADGELRMTYVRGVNAPCSMLKDPAGCAAQLEAKKLMSVALASRLKPGACVGPYAESSATDDNPSLLSHPVETVLAADQPVKRKLLGPLACAAMP